MLVKKTDKLVGLLLAYNSQKVLPVGSTKIISIAKWMSGKIYKEYIVPYAVPKGVLARVAFHH